MKGRSAVLFLLGILIGVFVASINLLPRNFYWLALLVTLAVFIFSCLEKKNKEYLILVMFLFLGIFGGGLRFADKENQFANSGLNNFSGQKIILSGFIKQELSDSQNTEKTVLETKQGDVLIIFPLTTQIYYGENFEIEGKLAPIKNFDDSFDYVSYEKSQGVIYEIYYPHIVSSGGFSGNYFLRSLYSAKNYFENNINNLFTEPYASLLSGMVIAGKGALPADLQNDFLHAGLMHIVVLSGYNIALVVSFATLIFASVHIKWRSAIILLLVVAFVFMAGLSASIIRAALMAVIALSGKILGRKVRQNRALVFGAGLMVFWNPYELVFDPSFALTFLATFAIINFSPVIERWLIKVPEKFQMREILSQTIAVEILVAPYLLYEMHNLALLSLVSNILVLPFVPWVTILGIIVAVFGFFGIFLYPIVLVLNFCLAWIIFVAEFLGNLSWAFISF